MNIQPVLLQTEAAAWDLATIKSGVNSQLLMAWAGQAFFTALSASLEFKKATTVIMILGSGNNAGDGYVLAWHLLQLCDKQIQIYKESPKSPDCQYFHDLVANSRSPLLKFYSLDEISKMTADLAESPKSILVEGLLGLGLSRPLSEKQNRLIDQINGLKIFRIAIDIPAGLSANGEFMGNVFKADHTYTFGAHKVGQLTLPGISFCGKITVLPIAFRKDSLPSTEHRLSMQHALPPLRHSTAHKYTSGVCHILGGSQGMEGAAILVAKSFLSLGGGLAKIYSHSSEIKSALRDTPELMIDCGAECSENFLHAIHSIKGKRVGIIGPGLSESLPREFWSSLFKIENLFLIIDGSALRQIAKYQELFKTRKHGWIILTPHAGEAVALNVTIAITNVLDTARSIAHQYASAVYFKGTGSFLIFPENKSAQIFFGAGSSALATGGTGDILCGVIANMLNRFDAPEIASETAIDLYIEAARQAQVGSSDFLTASELMDGLRNQMNLRLIANE